MNETIIGKMATFPIRLFFASMLLLHIASFNTFAQQPDGSLAVPFKLAGIDGKQFELKDLLSENITVIVFWSTWEKDTARLLDDLQKLYSKYRDRGLQIIGICAEHQVYDENDKKRIADSALRKQLQFPILLDDNLQTFNSYSVVALPTTFVITKNRKVVYKLSGYPIVGRGDLVDFIKSRFEEKHQIDRITKSNINKEAMRYFSMARLKLKEGLLEPANKYALHAAGLDTSFVDPLLLLAEIAVEGKNLDNAKKHLEASSKRAPESNEVVRMKGFLLSVEGKQKEALKILTSVVQKDSLSSRSHCYLAYALGMDGDLKASLDEFSRALNLDTVDYLVPLLRSEIYRHQNMKGEVVADSLRVKQLRNLR